MGSLPAQVASSIITSGGFETRILNKMYSAGAREDTNEG